jgi:hypothetical protein
MVRHAQILFCLLLAAASPVALAGRNSVLKSSSASVQLVGVLGETLSIVPAVSAGNASMQPEGIRRPDRSLSITTSWNLGADGTEFAVAAFLDKGGCAVSGAGSVGRAKPISVAEVLEGRSVGSLHPFPAVANGPADAPSATGSLVYRRQRTPGKSDMSSRMDAVELPAGFGCHPQDADFGRGVLTLVAAVY